MDSDLRVPKNCPQQWVVDCKEVGNGDSVILYLGKYLYKGVIQEKDILQCKNGKVTFRYLDSTTKQEETRTVSGEYFLYLLMLHVLPKGFRKIRSYGFLHPCSKKLISFLQMVLRVKPSKMVRKIKKRPKIICPACKATMEIILTRIPKPSRLKHCFT